MQTNRIPGLIADIELGKQSLRQVARHRQEILDVLDQEAPFFRNSGASVALQDFYNTVEKIFQQIAQEIDGSLPSGDAWHQQLLQRMTVAIPGHRPAVIDAKLATILGEYLRFRHLFHHIYGFELDWARIEPLLVDLSTVMARFLQQIDAFLVFLQTLLAD